MLAELPQIEKSRLMACGSSANQKKNVLAFAEVPQAKKKRFGICGSSANRKKSVSAFAEVPQAKKNCFGICGSSASISKNGFIRYSGFETSTKRNVYEEVPHRNLSADRRRIISASGITMGRSSFALVHAEQLVHQVGGVTQGRDFVLAAELAVAAEPVEEEAGAG